MEGPIARVRKPRRFRVQLPKKASIRQALRISLAETRDAAMWNVRGLRKTASPAYLHQMRVAVRGARALLLPMRSVYSERDIKRLGAELAWLARLTSPVRDLDVFTEVLHRYKRRLPQEARTDLEPFERLLTAQRRRAVRDLVARLDSKRYRNLMKDWKRFIRDADPVGKEPNRRARIVAQEWTWERYLTSRNRIRSLHKGSKPRDLHRARIELKKLRYLIEFFHTLFPRKAVLRILGPLKEAQDALGTLNDLSVHRSMIRGIARAVDHAHLLSNDTVIAMGELSWSLEIEQRRSAAHVDDLVAPFADKREQKRFRKLFKP